MAAAASPRPGTGVMIHDLSLRIPAQELQRRGYQDGQRPEKQQQVVSVIFDMDGTLTSSEHLNVAAWQATLRNYGADIGSGGAAASAIMGSGLLGAKAEVIGEYLAAEYALSAPVEELVAHKRKLAVDLVLDGSTDLESLWFEGVREAVNGLAKAGATVGLCTSNLRPIVTSILEAGAMSEVFGGRVVDQASVSSETMKPHPEPYAAALRQSGADGSKAVALEDSAAGIRSAVAAGVDTVLGVINEASDVVSARAALFEAGAKRVFDSTVAACDWIRATLLVQTAAEGSGEVSRQARQTCSQEIWHISPERGEAYDAVVHHFDLWSMSGTCECMSSADESTNKHRHCAALLLLCCCLL